MSERLDLIDTLLEDPKFSILAKALKTAGLTKTLKDPGPFTILAPSNLAFTKIPEEKLSALMTPLNKANLAEIMKYHILTGKIRSNDLEKLAAAETLQGQKLKIEVMDFGFKVNGANLQSRNIEAANGIIHVINAVLTPALAVKIR